MLDLPKLKGCWRDHEVGEKDNDPFAFGTTMSSVEENHRTLPSFPCLYELNIYDYPKLVSMPLYPHIEANLKLRNTSWKSFQQTMMNVIEPRISIVQTSDKPSTSHSAPISYSPPLSKLKRLHISENSDLQSLPDWWKTVSSLECLEIEDCPNLKTLSPGIQNLVSLQKLNITKCEKLDMSNHEAAIWQVVGSIRPLKLHNFRKQVALPELILHFTELRELHIHSWTSLTTNPNWIGHLKSLKTLRIENCNVPESLPEGRNQASLKKLSIDLCPVLLNRCETQIGQEWPKIAHIPDLFLWPDANEKSLKAIAELLWSCQL